MAMSEPILVIGESADKELRNVSFESIAAAKQINPEAEIVAVLLGNEGLQVKAEEMIQYGANRAIVVEHENLKNYTSEGYGQALLQIIEAENPYGVVMGHTAIGKDVTPKIAARLDIGLISDVVHIEKEDDQEVFVRPIYSGKAFEKKFLKKGLRLLRFDQTILRCLKKMKAEQVKLK